MVYLLLLKWLFVTRANGFLDAFNVPTFADAPQRGLDEEFVRTSANTFEVGWQVVLLRLQEVGFPPKEGEIGQQRVGF
jgi:hypothetical protein